MNNGSQEINFVTIDQKLDKINDKLDDVEGGEYWKYIISGAAGGMLHGGLQIIGFDFDPRAKFNGNDPLEPIELNVGLEWLIFFLIIAIAGAILGSISSIFIIGEHTRRSLIRVCMLSAAFGLFFPTAFDLVQGYVDSQDVIDDKEREKKVLTQIITKEEPNSMSSKSSKRQKTTEIVLTKRITKKVVNPPESADLSIAETLKREKSSLSDIDIEEKIVNNNIARELLSAQSKTDQVLFVYLDNKLTNMQIGDKNVVDYIQSFLDNLNNEGWYIPPSYYTLNSKLVSNSNISCKSIVRYHHQADIERSKIVLSEAKKYFQNGDKIANFEDEPVNFSDWSNNNNNIFNDHQLIIPEGQIDILIRGSIADTCTK